MKNIKKIIKELIGPKDPVMENIKWKSSSGNFAFPPEAKKDFDAFTKRWQASLYLGEIGAPAVAMLIDTLKHPNPIVIIATQHALRDMKEDAAPAIPALIENLTHKVWAVRRTSMNALARIGQKSVAAISALLERLKNDEDFENRGIAAWVIHQLAEYAVKEFPEVINTLANVLSDEEDMVRINVESVLRAMGKPELIKLHKRSHEPEQIVKGKPWHALERLDFLLSCQPLLTQSRERDQNLQLQAFIDKKMCNAFCFWPDHTWYNIPLPTSDQMKKWNMSAIWYYFTEDIYNPKNQREWGFRTLTDYNLSIVNHIISIGKAIGKGRCIWSVGHEQFDSATNWGIKKHGIPIPLRYKTKNGGYEFYRRWITTSIHKHHFNSEYGNFRPNKFYLGWNTGEPVTWEFVRKHNIDLSAVTMMSGGVSAVLAHAAFDILPQIEGYWWECQITGTSLQIGSAYIRGATRQYGRKWLLDASPWSPVFGNPKYNKKGENIGGVTDNQQMRTWLYGYLAGADCVFEEASGITHFYNTGPGPKQIGITSTGRIAKEVSDFCFNRCSDRGESYNPVGILVEHKHGYEPCPNPYFHGNGPWHILKSGDGEREIESFWKSVYPGHSRTLDSKRLPKNASRIECEPLCLHESVLGDVFDVLTDHCPEEILRHYPRLITLGGIQIDKRLLGLLRRYVRTGGELLVNAAHLSDNSIKDSIFGVTFKKWIPSSLKSNKFLIHSVRPTTAEILLTDSRENPMILENKVGNGKLILVTVKNSLTGKTIDNRSKYLPELLDFLKAWISKVYPVCIETKQGHLPHYMLNKLSDGCLITVGNHYKGKWSGTVILNMGDISTVKELWTQKIIKHESRDKKTKFNIEVPEYSFRVFRISEGEFYD